MKQYLIARGVSVTGHLKPVLVEIAKSVEKMLIPVLDYAKSKEENKLIIHGVEIEDPLSSTNEYVNDFNASPPFGLFDIFNHLIYGSTEHDKQGLAAYRAFDDFRIFEEGYVEPLLTKPLQCDMVGHLFKNGFVIWDLFQCIFFTKHFKRIYMSFGRSICVQNTHRYAYKTRIYMVFCMRIHASKRHIYMRLMCLVKNNTLD